MVKEFCLVPRVDYERKLSSYHPNLHLQTKLSSLSQISKPRREDDDSNLYDSIIILLNPKDHDYADGILSFLQKHSLIRWDKSRKLLSPIRDVNIVDIIRFWLKRNATFDPDKFSDLCMLVKLVDIPDSFIKNPKAKTLLYKERKRSLKKIHWIPIKIQIYSYKPSYSYKHS